MWFPLGFYDISLWLTITVINLIAISELTSPYYGRTKLYIRNERLRRVAVILDVLFLFTVAIEIYKIIMNL